MSPSRPLPTWASITNCPKTVVQKVSEFYSWIGALDKIQTIVEFRAWKFQFISSLTWIKRWSAKHSEKSENSPYIAFFFFRMRVSMRWWLLRLTVKILAILLQTGWLPSFETRRGFVRLTFLTTNGFFFLPFYYKQRTKNKEQNTLTRTGIEPRTLDPESSVLIIKLPHLSDL